MARPTPARRLPVAALFVTMAVLAVGCRPVAVERPIDLVGEGPAATSVLIGCDQATGPILVTATSHLDPACTYAGPVTISTSGVTLDCQGARIQSAPGAAGIGIAVATNGPADVTDLADVTVRNCVVKGFTNGIRVTRPGFRALVQDHEYEHGTAGILLENDHIYETGGSGVYVDAFVTGVTIRGLDIEGAGSVGIYLEAGSTGTLVEHNLIRANGWKGTEPTGIPFVVGSSHFRYISTGREGIAIDGSRDNRIIGNRIESNAGGGVLLYKNCGEYHTQKPDQWFHRAYGADDNLIEGNTIADAKVGVWVGSRMSQNSLLWDCSDPAYLTEGFTQVVLDHAARTTIRGNRFTDATTGVRVEDDDAVVEGNEFVGRGAATAAVMVGTAYRADGPGHPVLRTAVTGNTATIDGNDLPFVTIPGADALTTTFTGNTANGDSVDAVPVAQPPLDPFLLVSSFWLESS